MDEVKYPIEHFKLEAGLALPKFGEWDKDPSAAEGYTDIFNKVKEEKQTGSSKSPMITDDSIYLRSSTHSTNYKSSEESPDEIKEAPKGDGEGQ